MYPVPGNWIPLRICHHGVSMTRREMQEISELRWKLIFVRIFGFPKRMLRILRLINEEGNEEMFGRRDSMVKYSAGFSYF